MHIKTKRKWTEDEIIFLRENYNFKFSKDLEEHLDRPSYSINQKARTLGLSKSNKIFRKTNCEKLLDGSLESMYWIGFILADGHISNNNRLHITISEKDKTHLIKFSIYVNANIKNVYNNGFPSVNISIKDVDNIPLIVNKFLIQSNKTYNPPDFTKYNIEDDQMLALIIGFIDGDGNIRKVSRKTSKQLGYNITIKNHKSWRDNLEYISNFLKNIFDIYSNMKVNTSREGYSVLSITHNDIIFDLKNFISTNNIPVLERKWDIVDIKHNRTQTKLKISQIKEVIELYKNGTLMNNIAKKFDVSFSVIKRLVSDTST